MGKEDRTMEPFEARIATDGELTVTLPQSGTSFRLDSEVGYNFAEELYSLLAERYPSMIKAAEQKIKAENRSYFAMMRQQRRMYILRMVHEICACCFGGMDDKLDYDGEYFHFEYLESCPLRKYCPWNGYAARNEESMMVICGAKREYGLFPQERRVARLVQSGVLKAEQIADILQVSKSAVNNHLLRIYKKTGVSGMAGLIYKLKGERI